MSYIWSLVVPIASLTVAIATWAFIRRNSRAQIRLKKELRPAMGAMTAGRQAMASLLLLEGQSGTSQKEFGINGTITIGRSNQHAQLVLQPSQGDSPISRLHCTLLEHDGRFEIRDEATPNGTFVNGVRLVRAEVKPLQDGDTLEIAQVRHGGVKLKFQLTSRPGYTRTLIVPPKDTATQSDTPTRVIDK
jgi:pSer/pThr/pTyr-binding forkhead associated (FHA) protein